MRFVLSTIAISLLATAGIAVAPAGEMPALQEAAGKLRAATVTVRVRNPRPDEGLVVQPDGEGADSEPDAKAKPSVTVCSGVAVSHELVVTPVYAASDSEIRVTIAGG
nr:hypothetical protein [Planctomycetota bacterium]